MVYVLILMATAIQFNNSGVKIMPTIFSTRKLLGIILIGLIVTSCSGGTSSNTCQNPDDRASDGSRCGGRAASVRPGGN
ncbi:hypothetical protein PN473_12550 [Dolichospermum circinale CS-545/17]|nr:hypothetical protein [Dolichospermum circinale CS-545/17]